MWWCSISDCRSRCCCCRWNSCTWRSMLRSTDCMQDAAAAVGQGSSRLAQEGKPTVLICLLSPICMSTRTSSDQQAGAARAHPPAAAVRLHQTWPWPPAVSTCPRHLQRLPGLHAHTYTRARRCHQYACRAAPQADILLLSSTSSPRCASLMPLLASCTMYWAPFLWGVASTRQGELFLFWPQGGEGPAQRRTAHAPAQVCIDKEFPGRRHHLPNSPCHLAQGVSKAA